MQEIPEFYSDAIDISLNMPWTVALTFGLRTTEEERKPKSMVRVRMSPEHAKVTAMMLRQMLKRYESDSKTPINLPADLYPALKLSISDW
jgi:hypothetical protein